MLLLEQLLLVEQQTVVLLLVLSLLLLFRRMMPNLSEYILLPYQEYKRLLEIEKNHREKSELTGLGHHHWQGKETNSSKDIRMPNSEKDSASDLLGAGRPSTARHMSFGSSLGYDPCLEMPYANQAATEAMMRKAYGHDIETNLDPPREIPNVQLSGFEDNSDRIRAEARRDKTLPPSSALPLREMAPDLVGSVVPRGSDQKSHPPRAASHPPYYLGPMDDFSSEEEDF